MLGVMLHMDYVTESPALLRNVNYRKSAINGLLLFLSFFPWSRSNRKQMHIYTNEWEEFLLTYLVGIHPVAGIPKKWKFVFYMPDTVYFYSFIFLFLYRFIFYVDMYICASLQFYMKNYHTYTAQNIKFSIKDFFSKCDQILNFLRILSHLLKKSLTKNFIFCAVIYRKSILAQSWLYANYKSW